jgi:lauroyl/myristoyl acyltransferase
MLIDKPNCDRGVKVDFCGSPIVVPEAPAVLALRTGAKIIPGGVVHLPSNTLCIIIGKPTPFKPTGDLVRDKKILMQEVMEELEKLVKEYPQQLYAFHYLWA